MRRQFQLPEGDTDFLGQQNVKWETIRVNRQSYLLIHDYPVPEGYNLSSVQIALDVQSAYPDTQIDMVYFYPALHRIDGQPIGALTTQTIDGKTFQRWSRHRTSQNPWRPGVDDVCSHLALVDHWLLREFDLRPAA